MISAISNWAEQIIVAVIIATIIEMCLPSGNNKKYIKAVIGVYIMFTIISPILGKITNINFSDIDYEKYFEELNTSQAVSASLVEINDKTAIEMYETNLKKDMKAKLKDKGYEACDITIDIETKSEKNYGKIKKISIMLYKKEQEENEADTTEISISVNKIEEVNINNTTKSTENNYKKEDIKNSERNEIKKYLSSVYEVNKKNIKINE